MEHTITLNEEQLTKVRLLLEQNIHKNTAEYSSNIPNQAEYPYYSKEQFKHMQDVLNNELKLLESTLEKVKTI